MADLDFLNISDFITYPLITGSENPIIGSSSSSDSWYPSDIPRQGIADAGFVIGPLGTFDPEQDGVFLRSITIYASGAIDFDFRCDTAAMAGYRWLFSFTELADFGCTVKVAVTEVATGVEYPGLGYGYLTLGDPDALRLLLGTYYVDNIYVEQARLQSLVGVRAWNVNLANKARPCPEPCCDPSSSWTTDTEAYSAHEGLEGEIILIEGYNCKLAVNPADNSIEIGAEGGRGEGYPCEDILITSSGIQVTGSDNCDGEETCDGFVKSINGMQVTDGALKIVGLGGVEYTKDISGNKLTITPDDNRLCVEGSS